MLGHSVLPGTRFSSLRSLFLDYSHRQVGRGWGGWVWRGSGGVGGGGGWRGGGGVWGGGVGCKESDKVSEQETGRLVSKLESTGCASRLASKASRLQSPPSSKPEYEPVSRPKHPPTLASSERIPQASSSAPRLPPPDELIPYPILQVPACHSPCLHRPQVFIATFLPVSCHARNGAGV